MGDPLSTMGFDLKRKRKEPSPPVGASGAWEGDSSLFMRKMGKPSNKALRGSIPWSKGVIPVWEKGKGIPPYLQPKKNRPYKAPRRQK